MVFSGNQGYKQGVETIYEHMRKRRIAKIAILTSTSEFGRRGRTDLIKLAPKYGIKITHDGKYKPEGKNLKVYLTRVKGTEAQTVVNWSEGYSQVEICRNWKDLRMKLPLYQGPEFGNNKDGSVGERKGGGGFMSPPTATLDGKVFHRRPADARPDCL